MVLTAGIRYRWRWWVVGALSLVAVGLCGQFLEPNGSWAMVFVGTGTAEVTADFTFMLACVLFWKYRAVEPGIAVAVAFCVSFIPVLNYAGLHYFYWPGAFLALADAVFVACLARFSGELWARFKPGVPQVGQTAEMQL